MLFRPFLFAIALAACVVANLGAAAAQILPPGGSGPTPAPLVAPSTPATAAPVTAPSPGASSGVTATATPTATPATGRRLATFRVVADKITFFSNRYIMTAEHRVVLTLGDGTRVTGNVLYYDLRLNRLLIAGGVTIDAAHTKISGAAFAEYFDFDRAYFLPILSRPDRWTFVEGNYAHPLFGREMPGDTFYLPDTSGERQFLTSKVALVDPKKSVRFTPAVLNFGLAKVPFASYFLSYSPNPFFEQNALTGAFADGPFDFAGGETGLATLHLRYDNVDGVFPAIELHQVSNNSYIVLSINPLTRPFKQYNLLAYDRITPTLQIQAMIQESTFQSGFSQPLSAVAFANVQLTQALTHSYLQLTDYQYYESLLARPSTHAFDGQAAQVIYYYGDPTHNYDPNHPLNAQLAWIGFKHQINDLPINFQLRSSVGEVNNTVTPLQYLGKAGDEVPYTREYSKALGIDLTTNNLTIHKDKTGHGRDLYFTALYDRQRQYFSVPHHVDTAITSLSFTKVLDPSHLVIVTNYVNVNTGDYYGGQQNLAYPADAHYYNPYTGITSPVSPGFDGFSTSRSFHEQLVFTPSPAFAFTATMRENDDFPRPLPGTVQLVGDGVGFVNFGVTPEELDLDVRFRISRILLLDVSRSNYFNFAGYQRWSQNFNFQIEK